jgi:hypothetical protein
MCTFSDDPAAAIDVSGYRLHASYSVHAVLSLLEFATLVLLDRDTVSCLYLAMEANRRNTMALITAARRRRWRR